MYDLLSAYARRRQTRALSKMTVTKRVVWSLADARAALQRLAGTALDWSMLDEFLLAFSPRPAKSRSMRASAFAIALEMVMEGQLALRQDHAFAPLWVKACAVTRNAVEAHGDGVHGVEAHGVEAHGVEAHRAALRPAGAS